MRWWWLLVPVFAVVVSLSLAGCGEEEVWPTGDPFATDDPASREAKVGQGRQLFRVYACYVCHSEDGQRGTGPSLLNLYGSTVELADGSTLVADADYIRRSIREPNAQIVKGYREGGMSNYPHLRPSEVEAMLYFIHSLRSERSVTAGTRPATQAVSATQPDE